MKLLFDQNLSPSLESLLTTDFPGSMHVRSAGMASASDTIIWNFAKSNDFVIVSKDADFQQRALLRGHPPKVIWLRIGNGPTAAVANLLRTRMTDLFDFEADPTASLFALQ